MKIVVREWEQAVVLRDGRVERVLGPGRSKVRRLRTEIQRVDVRQRQHAVTGQEILTSDSIAVKVSVLVTWRVTDPVAFLTVSDNPTARLHAAVQQVLRPRVAERTLDDVLGQRGALADGLRDEIAEQVRELGVEVLVVDVRDLMLPAEIRHAVSEVLLARERGRAELERARAEAATLRSLANTARLVEDHPALLQLRTLQAAATGARVVITSGAVPVVAT